MPQPGKGEINDISAHPMGHAVTGTRDRIRRGRNTRYSNTFIEVQNTWKRSEDWKQM